MSTDSSVRWLGIYKIYLIIATVLCVISPMRFVFQAGFPDLTFFGSSVVRIIVFASAAATASRLADPSIRGFHLGLNVAGVVMGLLYLLMRIRFIGSLPLISEIAGTVGWIVVVPWNAFLPFSLYSLYAGTSVLGLVAASIWTYFLATYEQSSPGVADGYHSDHEVVDHSIQQGADHNIPPATQRRPWMPLLITFLIAFAINLIPFAVTAFENEKYGWLLFFITVPVGGVILLIGIIWSIVLVSNRH